MNRIIEEMLEAVGAEGWSTDGYGLDANLIAPDGCMIEQDGRCPHGHVSPLREAGMI
jgi:hypothetical protein